MRDSARGLGTLLGLIAVHGMPNIQKAVQALKSGTATPDQQKLCYQIIEGAAGL